MSESSDEFCELIENIAEKILSLTHLNCIGCQQHISSFKHHFCYYANWHCKVLQFFDEALQYFPESQLYSSEVILEELLRSSRF
jgi:hypothetical protein